MPSGEEKQVAPETANRFFQLTDFRQNSIELHRGKKILPQKLIFGRRKRKPNSKVSFEKQKIWVPGLFQ